MDEGAVIVVAFASIAALFGLAWLSKWYFSADSVATRGMGAVPEVAIEEVEEGALVRIVGPVEGEETVTAPMSLRDCVHWRLVVEERRGGKHRYWHALVEEEEGVDFFVNDETGRALVRHELTRGVLREDGSGYTDVFAEPPPELVELLEARGIPMMDGSVRRTIRYREGVAEIGEPVAVVGVGRWERDPTEKARPGEGYREMAHAERLVMHKPDADTPVLLSDLRAATRRDPDDLS